MPSPETWKGYLNLEDFVEKQESSTDAEPPAETDNPAPTPEPLPHPPTTVPPETPALNDTTSAPAPGSPATILESHPPTTVPPATPGSEAPTSEPTLGLIILEAQPLKCFRPPSPGPHDTTSETPSASGKEPKKRGRPAGSRNKKEVPPPKEDESDGENLYPAMGELTHTPNYVLGLPAEKDRDWDGHRERKAAQMAAKAALLVAKAAQLAAEANAAPPGPSSAGPEPSSAPPDPPTPFQFPTPSSAASPLFPTATSPLFPTASSPLFPTATSPSPTDGAGPSSTPPPVAATTLPPTSENSSLQRRRGRPSKRQLEDSSGRALADVGAGIVPTVGGEGKFISVEGGEDVYEKIVSFAKAVRRKVTVLCGVGFVSSVTMRPIHMADKRRVFEGVFDILYLHGMLTPKTKDSSLGEVSDNLKVQYADAEDGVLKTGTLCGPMKAIDTVKLTLMVEKPPEKVPEKKQRKLKTDPENPSEQKRKRLKKNPDMGLNPENPAAAVAL